MGGEDASARRPSDDPRQHVRWLNRLREDFVSTGSIAPALRHLVTESWQRSMRSGIDPEHSLAPVRLDDDTLDELRAAHPLEAAMPVIRRLLVDDAVDAGLLVAVSDAVGQLLWVEGDRELRARAEHMNFVPGADWSEHSAGTNAPGTALALGAPVQIVGAEHLLRPVTPWSCSAAPIREPDTGAVLGVIDVTGGDEAAGPTALALVRATVAAVEAELRLSRLIGPTAQRSAGTAGQPRLETLGRRHARLSQGDTSADLSLRHSEILLLLSHAPDGLSSAELAVELSDDDQSMVTVRAELLRLRAQPCAADAAVQALSVGPAHLGRGRGGRRPRRGPAAPRGGPLPRPRAAHVERSGRGEAARRPAPPAARTTTGRHRSRRPAGFRRHAVRPRRPTALATGADGAGSVVAASARGRPAPAGARPGPALTPNPLQRPCNLGRPKVRHRRGRTSRSRAHRPDEGVAR